MQLRDVLFQMRMVWSSEHESYKQLRNEWQGQQRRSYNPRHLVVELYSTDVVQMAMQSEEASSVLRPNVYGTSVFVIRAFGKRSHPRL